MCLSMEVSDLLHVVDLLSLVLDKSCHLAVQHLNEPSHLDIAARCSPEAFPVALVAFG